MKWYLVERISSVSYKWRVDSWEKATAAVDCSNPTRHIRRTVLDTVSEPLECRHTASIDNDDCGTLSGRRHHHSNDCRSENSGRNRWVYYQLFSQHRFLLHYCQLRIVFLDRRLHIPLYNCDTLDIGHLGRKLLNSGSRTNQLFAEIPPIPVWAWTRDLYMRGHEDDK